MTNLKNLEDVKSSPNSPEHPQSCFSEVLLLAIPPM